MTEQQTITPALAASQNSWRCVQARDKAGWLALMADDIVIEDPIGKAITNPDGNGVRGKAAMPEVLAALRSEVGPQRRAAAAALATIAGESFGYDPAKDAEQNRDAVRAAELWYLRNR